VVFRNILPEETPTFRDLIHTYLDRGGQYWSKLGIDMLLGVRLDREVTNREAMFLPEYLLKGMDSASVGNRPLVSPARTVLEMPSPLNTGSWFRPAVVFSILLVVTVALSLLKSRPARMTVLVIDVLFFFLLGLGGFVLLFMWFGTDHKVCQDNFNLLWALPTHAVMAFFSFSRKNWVRKYFTIVLWLTVALLAAWFFLPQEMNNALTPVLLLVIYRSWAISSGMKKQIQPGSKS
jgi:hypothetical protein